MGFSCAWQFGTCSLDGGFFLAMAKENERESALVAFVVTASGMSLLGLAGILGRVFGRVLRSQTRQKNLGLVGEAEQRLA